VCALATTRLKTHTQNNNSNGILNANRTCIVYTTYTHLDKSNLLYNNTTSSNSTQRNNIYNIKRPATTANKPVMPTPTWLAAPVNWGGAYVGFVGAPVPLGLLGTPVPEDMG